jgi:hypothetical protein
MLIDQEIKEIEEIGQHPNALDKRKHGLMEKLGRGAVTIKKPTNEYNAFLYLSYAVKGTDRG